MTLYDDLTGAEDDRLAEAEARVRDLVLSHLHDALQRSGMTQAELADRLGVRRSAVNQVFKGDGNMHVARVAAYLHVLGFQLDLAISPVEQPVREPQPLAADNARARRQGAKSPEAEPAPQRAPRGLAARGALSPSPES